MRNIVSFSGGKDSTAMLVRMLELGIQIDDIVFADTRLEFPELYDYIKKVETYIGRNITFVYGRNSWDSWFNGRFKRGSMDGRVRGFPYVIQKCWATRELKIKPLELFKNKEDMQYIGFTINERKRAESKCYVEGNYRFPLIEWGWSELDCHQYLKKKNLINPLYQKFKRLGCWCCPKQNMESLQILYQEYPKLWTKLKVYEQSSPHGFKPNLKLSELEHKFNHLNKIKNNQINQTTLNRTI